MRSGPEPTLRLFNEIGRRFDNLDMAAFPRLEHDIALAGQNIRLRFAGPALVDGVMPALSHLALDDRHSAPPDLTINLWDAKSTGCEMPPSPWAEADFSARREVSHANGPGYRVAYDLYCGIFSIVALDRKIAYWWLPDAATLPVFERAAPVREILHAWFDDRGGIFAHTAAIGNKDGAIMLVGKGGAGKSTTALACVSDDLRLIGEDYCLLTQAAGATTVHSLYASAKLSNRSLDFLPQLKRLVVNELRGKDDKAVLMTHPSLPMQREAAVRAIVLPRVAMGGETRLNRIAPTLALMALAPSSILQLSGMGQRAFDAFRQLVESTPAYMLDIAGNPESAAPHLEDLL